MIARERVRKYREKLRKAGMRPVQIWAPDTRRPGFAEEYRRQSRMVAQSDNTDKDLQRSLDDALNDIDEWTE